MTMLATSHPLVPSAGARSRDGLEGLATTTLRASLDWHGYPSDGAHVEYLRAGTRCRLILHLRPSIPWRVAQFILVQVVASLRRFDPEVGIADGSFEAIDEGGEGLGCPST